MTLISTYRKEVNMENIKTKDEVYFDRLSSYVGYLAKNAKTTASILEGMADTIKSRRFVTAKMLNTIEVQKKLLVLAQELNNKE